MIEYILNFLMTLAMTAVIAFCLFVIVAVFTPVSQTGVAPSGLFYELWVGVLVVGLFFSFFE